VLVLGQVLGGQPRPALAAEQVGGRAARHQVAVQDRLDLVLQPGPLPHDVGAADDLAARREGGCIPQGHTDGKNPAASSCASIAASTLSVVTFASAIARVFCGLQDHPTHLPFQQPRDRMGVAGGLQGHLVAGAQAAGELP
jgi:hypothetical protein